MYLDLQDTIVALASAPGGAARGIVRLSGPSAAPIAASCFEPAAGQPALESIDVPSCVEGVVRLSADLQERSSAAPAMLLVWPGCKSFTRQPVVEVHTIGSPPLLHAIVAALIHGGARQAERGEFTLRAFLAGRIDLTQAEAVLGVIDSQGDADLTVALSQLAGGLSTPLHQLRNQLLALLAELEAGLDFVEEDIQFIDRQQLLAGVSAARKTIVSTLQQLASRGQATARPTVALIGRSNVGKSSLFNRLVKTYGTSSREGTPTALVAPTEGTTRDYISAPVTLQGRTIDLIDTAGEMETQRNSIDELAQEAARRQGGQAAVSVRCIDASAVTPAAPIENPQYPLTVVAVTKADLVDSDRKNRMVASENGCLVSSKTGEGVPRLVEQIARALSSLTPDADRGCVATTAVRCSGSLSAAAEALDRAESLIHASAGDELVAAEIRFALAELGGVVGAVYTDDVLDRIFNQFCIGK